MNGLGSTVWVTDGSGVQTHFLYDGLGSTTDLSDGSGNVTAGYGYDVFGAIRAQSGGSPNEFKFTGEQVDADSGMYYLRARYYDPAIGRFLAQDPLPGGNLYAYVRNNPVRYVDRSGLCHVETGLWDQLCGHWAHNKEGSNFDATPRSGSSTRPSYNEDCDIWINGNCLTFVENCSLLCGDGEDNGIYGWDPNAVLAGVTTTIFCAIQDETWVLARGDWRVVAAGCAAVGAAAGAGYNIYTP